MKRLCLSAIALAGLLLAALGQNEPNPAAVAAPPLEWGPGMKVLIMGGGWAHDYDTWFNKADTATLHKAGITNTHYIDDSTVATRELPKADVFVLSCNKNYPGFITPEFRDAVSNYVNAGKGVVLLHSGLWFNWNWRGSTPSEYDEFNRELVGGGARDHDGVGPFTETVIKDHPVTHGLPATFPATDELYHTITIEGGSPREILVEASRPGGQKYASVWVVHYRDAKIVCIALGHDGNSHNSPDFQKLLVNAVNWAGGQH